MPQNKFQKFIFAVITVIITVNAFVFYNVFIVENSSYAEKGAIVIATFLIVEFICAITCELFIGSPGSFKLMLKIINPAETKPFMVETIIICCTVCIMCPLMSFIAEFLYNLIFPTVFNWYTVDIKEFCINFIPKWIGKVCVNFPFAIFSQMFFIQPLVRKIFRKIFYRQTKESAVGIEPAPED